MGPSLLSHLPKTRRIRSFKGREWTESEGGLGGGSRKYSSVGSGSRRCVITFLKKEEGQGRPGHSLSQDVWTIRSGKKGCILLKKNKGLGGGDIFRCERFWKKKKYGLGSRLSSVGGSKGRGEAGQDFQGSWVRKIDGRSNLMMGTRNRYGGTDPPVSAGKRSPGGKKHPFDF